MSLEDDIIALRYRAVEELTRLANYASNIEAALKARNDDLDRLSMANKNLLAHERRLEKTIRVRDETVKALRHERATDTSTIKFDDYGVIKIAQAIAIAQQCAEKLTPTQNSDQLKGALATAANTLCGGKFVAKPKELPLSVGSIVDATVVHKNAMVCGVFGDHAEVLIRDSFGANQAGFRITFHVSNLSHTTKE